MRICGLVDFDIQVDHKVKIEDSKKIPKYIEIAREQKTGGWEWLWYQL